MPVLLLAACPGAGERAQNGCPPGEVCSPKTPDGLFFVGPAFGDDLFSEGEPKTLAVGGSQGIRLVTGNSIDAPSLSLPFDAVTNAPAVTVDSVAPPAVWVVGAQPGTAYLRILDEGTDELFDRIELEAQDIATIDVKPLDGQWDEDFWAEPGAPWRLVTGGDTEALAQLRGPTNDRLIDQRLTLALPPAGSATGAQMEWDTISIDANAAGTSQLAIETGDGMTDFWNIEVVDDVDTIEPLVDTLSQQIPASMPVNQSLTFCFRATSGGAFLAGTTWTFLGTAGLDVTPGLGRNCANVAATVAGAQEFTVVTQGPIGADATNIYPIDVTATAARILPRPARPEPVSPSPAAGERNQLRD